MYIRIIDTIYTVYLSRLHHTSNLKLIENTE